MSSSDITQAEDTKSELLEKLNDSTLDKKPQYNNLPPKRKFYQKKLGWKSMPDRTIVTMIPDMQLPNNSIQTTKYNVVTFIPKNLMEQFSKLANVYFLIIGVLQAIPAISISNGVPVIYIPLSVILAVSALKDLIEDLKRRADDRRENLDRTLNLTDNGFQEAKWMNLRVGDIIKIRKDQYIPADVVLLKTSESDGSCFIETKNLDGETNLKPRVVDKSVLQYFKDENDLRTKHVEINYERPNPYLYTFRGSMKFSNGKEVPLTNNNFLLRSCSLKSDYAIGMVAYTGHDTKIMLNSVSARGKSSKVERMMNKQIIMVFAIQNIWCLLIAGYSLIWFQNNEDTITSYLDYTSADPELTPILYFLMKYGNWIVIFTNFVPISLLVTLEIVKFIQALIVEKDPKMVDDVNHTKSVVQTSRLMEELGQVNYIFSDKTGTLTCNVMEFKKLCVKGNSYGHNRDYEDIELRAKVTNVDFLDEVFFKDITNSSLEHHKDIHETLLLLSTCHTINVQEVDGERQYSASSPDEAALVNFAKLCGYEFIGISENDEMLIDTGKKRLKYKLHHILEFDSDRKRMSVIVQNPDGEMILFCKGADTVILDRKCPKSNPKIDEIMNHVQDYANQGLRTLLVAKKVIPNDHYDSWAKKYNDASNTIKDRETLMAQLQEEIEVDLEVIGATAIEDKLQDKVGESIQAFKEAGIKVWVLTGDKTETAINIGFSCRLLDQSQKIFKIDVETKEDLERRIEEVEREMNRASGNRKEIFALVITGKSLIQAQKADADSSLFDKLYDIFSRSEAVLACRVSPKQKRDIVDLVKSKVRNAVTLAIGDGANDVNMITAAHIGVGIKGLEGYQAARASDFAMGEFKLLRRLLFYYGRESYRKNSQVVLYNFFKNQVLILPQFWYGFMNGFSGTSLYEPLLFQGYNLFFTSLPIIIFAVSDKEFTGSFLVKHPRYYKPGLVDNYFNYKLFWIWFATGSIQAVFITLTSFGALDINAVDMGGQMVGFFSAGMMALSSLTLVANFKVLILSHTFSVLLLFIIFGSILFYIGSFAVLAQFVSSPNYEEFGLIFGQWNFYLGVVIMSGFTTLMDLAIARYKSNQMISQDEDIGVQLRKQSMKGEQKMMRFSVQGPTTPRLTMNYIL